LRKRITHTFVPKFWKYFLRSLPLSPCFCIFCRPSCWPPALPPHCWGN
jgi:hypothetical protein